MPVCLSVILRLNISFHFFSSIFKWHGINMFMPVDGRDKLPAGSLWCCSKNLQVALLFILLMILCLFFLVSGISSYINSGHLVLLRSLHNGAQGRGKTDCGSVIGTLTLHMQEADSINWTCDLVVIWHGNNISYCAKDYVILSIWLWLLLFPFKSFYSRSRDGTKKKVRHGESINSTSIWLVYLYGIANLNLNILAWEWLPLNQRFLIWMFFFCLWFVFFF